MEMQNAKHQERMIESAMSLSMFSRNNMYTVTMQMYHTLKADCQTNVADSPQAVAFLKLKLNFMYGIR